MVIESIELNAIYVFPNDDVEVSLLQSITVNTRIIMPFMKWGKQELPSLKTEALR